MASIEKDANERADTRRQHRIVADEFKRKGNDAFHQQLYDQAIDFYTQVGIDTSAITLDFQPRSAGFANEERLRRAVHQSSASACETGQLRQGYRRLRLGSESEHSPRTDVKLDRCSSIVGHTNVDQGSHHQRQMLAALESVRSRARAVHSSRGDRAKEFRTGVHASYD